MGNSANIKVGDVTVSAINDPNNDTLTDIGFTSGGVTFTAGADAGDVDVDQLNVSPKRFLATLAPKVSFGLAETTITNMTYFVPGGSLDSSDFVLGLAAGDSLQELSVKLSNSATVIYLPRCVPMGNPVLPTVKGEASIIPVELGCLLPNSTDNDLVTNGTFAADSDWTKGTGWTISGGTASAATSTDDLSQTITLIEGVDYEVTFTVSGHSAGTLQVEVNGTAGTTRSGDGTFTETIKAGSSGGLVFDALTSLTCDIDNVTCHPVNAVSIIVQ